MLEQCSILQTETLEISGIPENIDNGELEGKVLTVLSKLDVSIDPANVEACHWLKSHNKGKKAILKLFRRKDSDEIRRVRSKLKTTDLKPIGITTPVYINDSLCFYYKKLWSKCKKLCTNKFIFVSNRYEMGIKWFYKDKDIQTFTR